MSNLITITEQDFDPSVPIITDEQCALREAARAVLLSEDGKVYLMHVTKHGYHKLPGGGVDEGEAIEDALRRELLEEVGCTADISDDLGTITEYRKTPWHGLENMKQISYCYIARQTGEQQEAALEESELEEGMIEVKADSIAAAIELLKNDQPDNLEGKFIQKRDLTFLRQAATLL